MALSSRFSLLNASFDRFLFASIGDEESGMPLSVASALARLGRDPWVEAGRLAQLPREAATEALATMIASISPARVAPSDAPSIAARLVLLLPSDVPSVSSGGTGSSDRLPGRFNILAVLLCLSVLALGAFCMVVTRGPAIDTSDDRPAINTPLTP